MSKQRATKLKNGVITCSIDTIWFWQGRCPTWISLSWKGKPGDLLKSTLSKTARQTRYVQFPQASIDLVLLISASLILSIASASSNPYTFDTLVTGMLGCTCSAPWLCDKLGRFCGLGDRLQGRHIRHKFLQIGTASFIRLLVNPMSNPPLIIDCSFLLMFGH